jgi:hypothetical protein
MRGFRGTKGERAKAADVVARARALRTGDYARWRVLAELDDIGVKTVFDTAAGLIEAGDRESVVLGAEILDGVFTTRYHEGRRFADAGEKLLGPLCRPDQDPIVLSTALHPYATICSIADTLVFELLERLYELLEHRDARVRASACQLIAVEQEAAADNRIIEALLRKLGQDPDDDVRARAADGLLLAYVSDERCQPQIADALARYTHDAHPAVRAAAIQVSAQGDAERILEQLTAELRDPNADWRFVLACHGGGFWESASYDRRAEATRALTRLQEQNWAARGAPGQYPLTDERAEMLAEAIDAVTP